MDQYTSQEYRKLLQYRLEMYGRIPLSKSFSVSRMKLFMLCTNADRTTKIVPVSLSSRIVKSMPRLVPYQALVIVSSCLAGHETCFKKTFILATSLLAVYSTSIAPGGDAGGHARHSAV